MITDTAFHRYRHYHAPSDTPDKLAYPELARVTSGLFAAFSELSRGGPDCGSGRKHSDAEREACIRHKELRPSLV